jgi:hypothetical protein
MPPDTPAPGEPLSRVDLWALALKSLAAAWHVLGYLYADDDRDAILDRLEPDELAIVLHVEYCMGVVTPPPAVLATLDLVEAMAGGVSAEHLARP